MFVILPQRDPLMNPLSEAFEKCNQKMKKTKQNTKNMVTIYGLGSPSEFLLWEDESLLVKNV